LIFKDSELLWLVLDAAKQALAEDLGHPLTALEGLASYPDPNDWRAQVAGTAGLWLAPMATHAGRRSGTREYIRKVQREFPQRLIVKTNTLVTRVLFEDGNRAAGVEFVEGAHQYRADPNATADAPGRPQQVRAMGEVILSAGAFNTPQLLMLSGVGAADELREVGIPVVVDLPGVGKNLQDRYEVGVVIEMQKDFALLEGCGFAPPATPGADPCFTEWEQGRGVYTTNGVVLGITKKAEADRDDPDLFIFGLPAFFHGYYPGYSADLERSRNLFTWAILKAHTRNTAGTVRLKSADPRDVPAINFRYFEEGNDTEAEDLESLVLAIEFVRRLTAKAGSIVARERLPGPDVRSREQLEDYVRRQAWGHHASCTCKLGPQSDPTAVVDSNFRVHGTRNLRVVDASVFPNIPGFFIVSAVYMISEKASDVILADAAR
jgi:choline dehydrogenase